jgi:hydroxymethylglutaryl-CoA lyase
MEVIINEVGLRDGLQNQPSLVSTADKLALLELLESAGLKHIEVASFVHPKAVPQMADAEAVVAGLDFGNGQVYSGLVPNLRGYDRGAATGLKEFGLIMSASSTFSERNVKMSLEQSYQACSDVIKACLRDGNRSRVYISCSCACPYEGRIQETVVLDLARRLLNEGAHEVSISDTIGAGTPKQIFDLSEPLISEYGASAVNLHVHDTRGAALAMVWSAYLAGVRMFDASIGGLGGCPFAPGATGNVATEDLVYMFNQSGIPTNIDFDALEPAVAFAEKVTASSLGGKSMQWLRSKC